LVRFLLRDTKSWQEAGSKRWRSPWIKSQIQAIESQGADFADDAHHPGAERPDVTGRRLRSI